MICHFHGIFSGVTKLISTSMGQPTYRIAAFGLRKVHGCTLKLFYILQRWLSGMDGFMATFILEPFFDKIISCGLVTCFVTGPSIPQHAANACYAETITTWVFTSTVFIQDGLPHISMNPRHYCSNTLQMNVLVTSFLIHD